MLNNKDKMHPDDMRNLLIFFMLSLGVYYAYTTYIIGPKNEALRQAQQAEVDLGDIVAPGGMKQEAELRERSEVLADNARIALDNGQIFGSISLKGARLDDIRFSNHFETLKKENNVILLSPKATQFPRHVDYGWVAKEEGVSLPGAETLWQVQGNQKLSKDAPVSLFWENGQGLRFERNIEMDDSYVFKITQRVINKSGKDVTLYPFGLISQTNLPPGFQGRWISHEGPIGYIGEELEEISYKSLRKEPVQTAQGMKGWAGITDKYWLTTLIPAQNKSTKYRFNYIPSQEDAKQGRYQVDFLGAPVTVKPGNMGETSSHLFTGVKEVIKLEEYEKYLDIPHFDLAVDFGTFYFMTKPFFYCLHFLGKLTGNFGVAIIILTFFLRMAVFPLTNISYRSFAKMKKISPQIVELRETHGDDKTALQQELMKLYEREGVNPMAGCIPILFQMPIFFALYKTLFVTMEMRHEPFILWIKDLSAPDPTTVFNLFGLLPYDPTALPVIGAFLGIGVLPLLMGVAMWFQTKLNPPPADPVQAQIFGMMPFVFVFIFAPFAAGLVLYWFWNTALSILQQWVIMKKNGVTIDWGERFKLPGRKKTPAPGE